MSVVAGAMTSVRSRAFGSTSIQRRKNTRVAHTLVSVAAPLVLLALVVAGWQWVATTQTSVLPTIGSVYDSLVSQPGFYWEQARYTLTSALVGLALGVSVAWLLAVVVVYVPLLRSAIMPIAVAVHATPIVAVAPALVVAFGFGRTPHLIVVGLMVFFPMLVNAISGLRSAPPEILEVFESMSASRWDTFVHLRLPVSLPYLFAAGKTCVTLAMIGAVVSEFHGASEGLGACIVQAMNYLDLPQMWAAIALSAVASLIMLSIVGFVEKSIIRW